MIIRTITLTNFRQYRHSKVDLSLGLTAILGQNGTGKSTLLESIGFALFGKNRADKDGLAFAYGDSKKYSVVLVFGFDGRTYECMRSESAAYLKDISGGVERAIATNKEEVTKAVERLLGLNFDEFKNSFWAQQKELAFLNFKDNAETQKKVNKMLGYDRVQAAEDLAREKSKSAKTRVEALKSVMGDIATLRADAAAKETELTGIVGELTANESKRAHLESRRESVETQATRAKEYARLTGEIAVLVSRYVALREARTTAEAEVAQAQTQVSRRSEIEGWAQEYVTVCAELDAILQAKGQVEKRRQLEDEKETEEGLLRGHTTSLNNLPVFDSVALASALANAKQALIRIKQASDTANQAWTQKRSQATQALAVAEADLRNITRARQTAEENMALGVCPECKQPFAGDPCVGIDKYRADEAAQEQLVAQARQAASAPQPADIEKLNQEVGERSYDIQQLEEKLAQAQKADLDRIRFQSFIDSKTQKISSLTSQLADLPTAYDAGTEARLTARNNELKPLHTEYNSLTGASDRLERAEAALATAQANMASSKLANDTLRAEQAKLGFATTESAEAAETALVTLELEAATLATEARGLGQRKQSAESALASAGARVEEYKTREAELKTAQAEQSLYTTVANEMKALRLQLNASVRPELAERASRYMSLITNGRYNVVELTDTFQPIIIDDGIAKSVASGGEEDAQAVAFRLALSEMIQERQGRPMSLLILDEIFGSLDADRRQAVLDCLIGLKPLFDQIILISHIEGTSEVADNCIYLTRDPETKSTVVGDAPDFELPGEAA